MLLIVHPVFSRIFRWLNGEYAQTARAIRLRSLAGSDIVGAP